MCETRDLELMRHIARYCVQVDTAHMDFGASQERFQASTTYQNAVCMCILQIGELVGKLSDTFRQSHPEIPWYKIRGMRNFVAHEYGSLDLEIVWYVATQSIPALRRFCEEIGAKAQP